MTYRTSKERKSPYCEGFSYYSGAGRRKKLLLRHAMLPNSKIIDVLLTLKRGFRLGCCSSTSPVVLVRGFFP